ncbi:MAG TPA: type II secretion system F family protein [Vicinamibacterales bacterium]|jgi:tight adherence protein B|nr:type II secretion system F family protein [Vicinamibacterales bacterium]
MFLAFLVFVVVSGSIIGGYYAATTLPGVLAARKLDRRLQDVSADPFAADEKVGGEESILQRKLEGPLPGMDRLVSGTGVGKRMARLIEQSGVKTTPSAIVVMCFICAALCGVIAFMFIPQRIAPLMAALFGAFLPFAWLLNRRSVRLKKFEEQFPEALDLLARAIRAGHALQTALGMAADELPEPVGPEFKKTFDQQNFGLPLRDALNEMSVRIGLLDVRFFVTAVLIQRDTGGNLSEILENLAHVVRERFKIRRQVRVHTAHGRFTGYVLLALPAALAVALSFINPDHMQALFRERMGQMMLMGAIVMQTIGFFWIRQVIKIEV